jgi:heme/copper-type cytochrome/quinol oxidase subunit 4
MSAEEEKLVGGTTEPEPIYHDKTNHPIMKYILIVLSVVVGVFTLVTVVMASVQSAIQNLNYILLLLSFVATVQVVPFFLFFIKKEYISHKFIWFVFFFAAVIILESIFTDVLIFSFDCTPGPCPR